MRIALLDRRFGTYGGHNKNNWNVLYGVSGMDARGRENTFSIIDAFGEVMTGPLELGTDYKIVRSYDLIFLRIRAKRELDVVRSIRKICKNSILIGYCDEWVGFKTLTPSSWLTKISRTLDAITCGFGKRYEEMAFQLMGIKNYYHLPYAGPIEYWQKWFKPKEKRENAIAGMWHIRSFLQQGRGNPAHTITLKTLYELQKRHGVDCWFFLNFDGKKLETKIRKTAKKIGLKVELLNHMSNKDFNERMSRAMVFMEEYQCPNYSRATVVSAAVGTPQVGTDMNEPSKICFPDLTVKHGEWNRWLNLGSELLTNDGFWKVQSLSGVKNVSEFSYGAFKKRVETLYNELREKQ